ncbi:MAG: cell division protein FtsZ [Desulfovibrio sp.]|jgi:cell division protein FtsZ|nr:cell division protein FtsZ [Desulfovibrio sp.]
MSFEFIEIGPEVVSARIKVVGVGGGGGNAVNNMFTSGLQGVTFIAANTDRQALAKSQAENKVQLGLKLTKGLGAGANPCVGRDAALENLEEITALLSESDMVFVTAGMGGGTGTGAAPIIAQTARETGALTVAVVTRPFFFEGKPRQLAAERGIAELRQYVDSLIVIPNDRLLQLAPKKAPFQEMLKKADEVLYYAVKGISDLIMVTGLINLDFADVRTVMSESGLAMMGTGIACGENRAREAAMKAITSPLLEGVSIDGATAVLMNVTCGPDLTIDEISEAAGIVQEAAHDDVHLHFGTVTDETIGDEMRITVIATGIDNNALEMAPRPAILGMPRQAKVSSPPAQAASPAVPPVETGLRRSPVPPPQAAPANLNIPAYLRKENPSAVTSFSGGAHVPGGEDFIFGEDDFETPSFLRKQAN